MSPDELGMFPDELGMFPDELGMFPDELGMFPDELGMSLDAPVCGGMQGFRGGNQPVHGAEESGR